MIEKDKVWNSFFYIFLIFNALSYVLENDILRVFSRKYHILRQSISTQKIPYLNYILKIVRNKNMIDNLVIIFYKIIGSLNLTFNSQDFFI